MQIGEEQVAEEVADKKCSTFGEEQVADKDEKCSTFNWSLRLKAVRSPSQACASTNSFTVGEKGKENDLEILQWKTMKHQN